MSRPAVGVGGRVKMMCAFRRLCLALARRRCPPPPSRSRSARVRKAAASTRWSALTSPGSAIGRHHGRLPRRREGRAADAARACGRDRRLRGRARRRARASTRASTRRASRRTPATTSPASGPTTISCATRPTPGCWRGELRDGRAVPARRARQRRACPRRPPRWRASWTRSRRRTRRWTCTRTTSSTASLFYAYVFGDRDGLPAPAGAVGRAGPHPAQQHRRFRARAGHRRPRRRRGVHRLPRRQHHRPVSPGRRPLHGGDRDHHRDPWPPGRRDQPDLDPRLHRPGRGQAG